MIEALNKFFRNEDGAVTVDWVVLTAGVVGLGLVVMSTIKPTLVSTSSKIATNIDSAVSSNASK